MKNIKLEHVIFTLVIPFIGSVALMSTVFAWQWEDFFLTYAINFVLIIILFYTTYLYPPIYWSTPKINNIELNKQYIVKINGITTTATFVIKEGEEKWRVNEVSNNNIPTFNNIFFYYVGRFEVDKFAEIY